MRPVILLVSGVPSLTNILQIHLKNLGLDLEILLSKSYSEAVEVLSSNQSIMLMITDNESISNDPAEYGHKLATFVRENWPNIKILLISGHPRLADHPGIDAFFGKPFPKATEIRKKLNELLATS